MIIVSALNNNCFFSYWISMFNTAECKFNTAEHKFNTAEHRFNTAEHRFLLGTETFFLWLTKNFPASPAFSGR